MTSFDTNDVIIVPFPFSDLKTVKKRPAIVISSLNFNVYTPDIVIMAVTSQSLKKLSVGECFIEDWSEAGLVKRSVVKPAIATIEQNLVIRKIGKLSDADSISLQKLLRELLFDENK